MKEKKMLVSKIFTQLFLIENKRKPPRQRRQNLIAKNMLSLNHIKASQK